MADQLFYTILTKAGLEKQAAALTPDGEPLRMAHMAVGDGEKGAYYEPKALQTSLKNETWRGELNSLKVDKANPNWVIAEVVLPEEVGGFEIREVGVYDHTDTLIAIGKYPLSYKPVMVTGAARQMVVRAVFQVSNAANVVLQVDPSIVMATRQHVDDLFAAHGQEVDPHVQYWNETRGNAAIASALAARTLNAGRGVTITNGNGVDVNPTISLSASGVAAGSYNSVTVDDAGRVIGGNHSAAPVGQIAYFAMSAPPEGWLKCNGAALSRTNYATLFTAIGTTFGAGDGENTFTLPDCRGEFLRGWDDARGVDNSRVFGSLQMDEIKSHIHGTQYDTRTPSGMDHLGAYSEIGGVGAAWHYPTTATGGSETRPRNLALLPCIKY